MDSGSVITAFILGFAGSLHCVGMCGPLMMTGLFQKHNQTISLSRWGLYHVGRIGVYATWGVIFGLIGTSVKWFGWQQNISISLGAGILLVLVLSNLFPQLESRLHNMVLLKAIRRKLVPYIHSKTPYGTLLAGMLNGVLPCGLVYVALAGATAMQNIFAGGMFMVFFGMGNLPMLFTVMIIGRKMQFPLKKYFSSWYPLLIGMMAILLIVRGMNWGNYLSPALMKGKVETVHCASR